MIAKELLQTGILQIGWFEEKTGMHPYRLRFEMLPAYPRLLEELSREVIRRFSQEHINRIVADTDVMSIGVLLSISTHIPLVYSRGRGEVPVHDLVGAYDVGHPAVLLVGETGEKTLQLIQSCGRVGLEVQQVIAVVGETANDTFPPVLPVLEFSSMLAELTDAGLLPPHQAQAMQSFRT